MFTLSPTNAPGGLLARGVGEGGFSVNLPLPFGFDWTPPVGVRRSGTSFATNFNSADWQVSATASVYVALTGNDTTGTGAQATPYKTIKKGLAAALALPDASVNLYIAAGTYDRSNHFNGTACAKNLNIIAQGGRVKSSCRYEALTWTLHATGVYKATRSSVSGAYDEAFTDTNGAPVRLVSKALLADCVSTANSWYTDGTTLYIHTTDGRQPDTSLLVMAGIQNALFNANVQWYVEGLDFEGAANPFNTATGTIGAASRIVFNNCTFRMGCPSTNGLSITGVPLVISNNCTSYANEADGFNYHGATLETHAIEINCTAYSNGLTSDAANNDNGSTCHESSRLLRVNGNYYSAVGPVVCDINTTQSWNLGCQARNSTSTVSDVTASGFRAQDSAAMYLDTCTTSGNTYSASTNSTAIVRTRNCTLAEATFGDVAAY